MIIFLLIKRNLHNIILNIRRKKCQGIEEPYKIDICIQSVRFLPLGNNPSMF